MTEDFRSADAIITNSRNEVLLQLRDDKPGICWPGYWVVPGGQREPGETPYQTAVRELREETGLDVPGLLPFDPVPLEGHDTVKTRFFHAVWDGDPGDLVLGEGQELRFVPLPEARSMKMPPAIKDCLRQLERRLRIRAGFEQHQWLFDGYPCAFGWACTYTTDTAGRPVMLKSLHKGWQLCAGGMIDPDELPWEAAIRETKEETGRIIGGEPKLLAAVFRLPTEEFPTRFGYVFDGGEWTAEEIAGIVLDPKEHTDFAVRSLEEWQPLVPAAQFELLRSLDVARRTGVAAYITAPVD